MKKVLFAIAMLIVSITSQAQDKQDTVVIELAKTSRVIFTMRDKQDLDILKHYDFNQLFADILKRLETRDSSVVSNDSTKQQPSVAKEEAEVEEDWSFDNDHDNDDRRRGTTQSFNIDLGTNNYLMDGKFPDADNALFAVRPWGSWYVGLASIQRTRLGKSFFLEWGLGASWYNFKFQKDNVLVQKTDNGVEFIEDTRDVDFKKSKLSASFITASLVPVIDFSGHGEKSRIWDGDAESFRLGIGPYIGYRISSHTKLVYDDDNREKDKERDNFYLNNFRYGVRLQIGYRSTDLFFNYDLNSLFAANKGPKLNAFSFGVTF